MSNQVSDEMLLTGILQGDKLALEQFYDRYERMVYSFAYRCTSDPLGAEEITQDVFLKLWRTTVKYDPKEGKVSTWLLMMTRNASIDYHRRQRRHQGQSAADEVLTVVPDASPGPDSLAELSDLRESVKSAMDTLPTDQKQVVEEMYFQGRTQQEIADALGISVGTVKSRVRLAMQKLRQQFTMERLGAN